MFSESDGQAVRLSEAHQSDEAPRPDSSLSELSHSAEPDLLQQSPGAPISKPVCGVVLRKSSSDPSEEPSLHSVHDADEGKIRGPNGRYLPKEDPPVLSPRRRKNGKKRKERARMAKVKEAENQRSAAGSNISEEREERELQPETPALVQDEDVFADVQTPSPSTQDDTIEVHRSAVEHNNYPAELAQDDNANFDADADTDADAAPETTPGPTSAYLLAAEADAVPSNLDRLPPTARRTSKRKSEPITRAGLPKKRRVGRPRQSEQLTGGESLLEQVSPQTEIKDIVQMTTRRTTRRSDAAWLAQETPEGAPKVLLEQAPTAKPAVAQEPGNRSVDAFAIQNSLEDDKIEGDQTSEKEDEDVTIGGIEEDLDVTAGHEEEVHAPAPSASEPGAHSTPNSQPSITPAPTTRTPPKISEDDLFNIGLKKTTSPAPQRVGYVSPYPVPPPPPPLNFMANMNRQNAPNGNMANGTSKFSTFLHVFTL
jgi:hypothetical protein